MSTFSFRELSALGSSLIISLVALIYLPDALAIAADAGSDWGGFAKSNPLARMLIVGIGLLVTLQIGWHIVLAIVMKQDAEEPADERDRLVSLKADRVAYYVLALGGAALLMYLMWFGVGGVLAATLLLTLLVVADSMRYLAAFMFYRMSV